MHCPDTYTTCVNTCFTQNLTCITDCALRQATENYEEVNIQAIRVFQKFNEKKSGRKQTEGEKYYHH